MSDSYHALTVALETDIGEEGRERIVAAIESLRGVLKVEAHVNDFTVYTAMERARIDLGKRLWEVLYPEKKGK